MGTVYSNLYVHVFGTRFVGLFLCSIHYSIFMCCACCLHFHERVCLYVYMYIFDFSCCERPPVERPILVSESQVFVFLIQVFPTLM